MKIAEQYKDFEIEVLDLKEINLPFLDESEHPILQKYTNAHTRSWSSKIDEADAFVIVTPEYNHSYPVSIKNVLDYLVKEWQNKPMGFVGYGGVSAETRAVQDLKIPVTTLGMMPIPQEVTIPFFNKFINNKGVFEGNAILNKAANVMLDNLQPWAEALKEMREKAILEK